ncbi:MAG: FMN-binding protein, partial [Ilumatobacteraceae bacterium]
LAALFARADDQQSVAGSADDPDVGGASGTVVTMPPATTGSTPTPGSTTSTPPSTTQVEGIAIEDGTYTGDAFTNRWGVVQVEITYAGGAIIDVGVLRYPDSDRKSVSINQRALPLLEDAVLAAQGSGISSITGATITSRSYRLSLQSAIDAAVAASAAGEG